MTTGPNSAFVVAAVADVVVSVLFCSVLQWNDNSAKSTVFVFQPKCLQARCRPL